ncbi:nucleoside 2-deoxyribosyltransferase [Bittarella massiliensis (ex Durand et al. 2017)]|uniref:nucleoside 2-deoxyribosyltransferase n=1 Tax=Bittarella massiliensis (ex Durand et al. 2017) TaxID=1720313 RepID=UPI00073F7F21|nr:nucleoside 2-deoxyribosyltransferase [Bittarella massiliensis (ex Durand et al. 2017)]
MNKKPKVYIAGPECFFPNSEEIFAANKAICEELGFEPSVAADYDFSGCKTKQDTAKVIFEKNIESIKNCDLIVADMNNFRGWEPDSGTSFEIGVGYIWGKKIYVYLDDLRSCGEKFTEETYLDEQGRRRDKDGLTLEGGPLNLMISGHATMVEGTFRDALLRAKEDMEKEGC